MRKVQSLISEAIGREEVARTARAQIVFHRWEEVVGSEMASRSYPDRYERGTVWVAVNGSAWAQELRMMKDRILKKLCELSEEPDLFKEIRFGVRPIVMREVEEIEVKTPRSTELESLSIREIAERRLKNWPHAPGD
jgi:predicted nucleic acid-binding Zn ribbon protein